jgi:pimeloyl-ACP methyl ester carboxylesterase
VFNLSGSTDSLQDSLPDADLNIWGPNSPIGGIYYQIQAHYASGDSAWSAPVYVQPNAPATISLITGPQQAPYLAVASLPAGTTGLEILQIEPEDPSFNLTNVIEVASSTNGFYPMPAAVITNPTDTGSTIYNWDVELLDANGQSSGNPLLLTGGFIPYVLNNGGATNWMVAPYFDGRVQMKQNLAFLLRAAMTDMPFQFTEEAAPGNYPTFTSQTNFVISDFYSQNGYGGNSFAPLQPFVENYLLRNFAFASPDEGTGRITTGVSGDYDNYYDDPSDNPTPLILASSATYQLSLSILEAGSIPALLDTNTTEWQCSYALDSPSAEFDDTNNTVFSPYLGKIGVAALSDADLDDLFYTMSTGVRNYWGLPFLSTTIAYPNSTGTGAATTVLDAGSQVENVDGDFYPQTAQPVFQTAEYDFWAGSDPLPESANFSTTNQTDHAIIVPVGQSTQVLGYAKLAVQNGYPGVYGYLGQYFTNAYEIDTNGNVTTNTTGMLSPYGNFFATQPGPVALVTMPDPDTEQQGTCTVYAVSLAVDKNNDGIINTNFAGPDATSQNSPYVFWANNNYDRWKWDDADETNYLDDVQVGNCPYTPNTATPDCNYRDMYGNRVIPDTRDLEDYARLWVCGVTSNLLTNLPTGSTVTLNWGDVGNPNPNNPTIDLFQAVDPNGGIGYLTNETAATEQINPVYSAFVGRVEPGQSVQLNSSFFSGWAGNNFIWCGVSNGTGGLNLTIMDANSNVLAQTTAYIQIVDIKQMYERWTLGDQLTAPPLTNAIPATENLPVGVSAFQYSPPTDTNTPYILFVHGWNMEPWEKDRFAETAFKRLYWQGYQGRFGLLRWPTGNDFTGDMSQLLADPTEKDNYDSSEYNAWLSGAGLLNKLTDLNTEYSGHVYVLAHSMGNVVTGEALRLAGDNQVVNTYVASQAALSAHLYDATVPDYSFTRSVPLGPIMINYSFGLITPDIYVNWFADNNGDGAGQVISFYNTNDYALSFDHWQLDEVDKPDVLVVENRSTWNYGYNGSANDPAPWNNFFKTNDYTGATINFDIVNTVSNRYEVMAYAAQSYTTALGATPSVHNVAKNVDLTDQANGIWPLDPTGNNYQEHFWHSAEFRDDNAMMQGYWNYLLGAQTFGLK